MARSKVLLLARDHEIRDPTILQQLAGYAGRAGTSSSMCRPAGPVRG
ncbi:MAG TPA: hypothetical protein VK817_01615 [Trebonia sp.]|nr:hypothetical protein [Trebonia sp.]